MRYPNGTLVFCDTGEGAEEGVGDVGGGRGRYRTGSSREEMRNGRGREGGGGVKRREGEECEGWREVEGGGGMKCFSLAERWWFKE